MKERIQYSTKIGHHFSTAEAQIVYCMKMFWMCNSFETDTKHIRKFGYSKTA